MYGEGVDSSQSSDDGKTLKYFQDYRFVDESEDIYPWPNMSGGEISLSRRIRSLMVNSRTSISK